MRKDQLYLAATINLLSTSLASSIAAFNFYTESSKGPDQPQPKGSFSDDGSWTIFSDTQFWDPFSSLTGIFSSNSPFSGPF